MLSYFGANLQLDGTGLSSQEEAQQKSANGNGKKRQYAEPWIFHGTGPPALTRTEKADIIFWVYYTRYFPAGQVRQSNIEGEI